MATPDHRAGIVAAFTRFVGDGDAGPETVEAWLATLDISPNSRYDYLATVSRFYRRAGADDPTAGVERPSRSRPRRVGGVDHGTWVRPNSDITDAEAVTMAAETKIAATVWAERMERRRARLLAEL